MDEVFLLLFVHKKKILAFAEGYSPRPVKASILSWCWSLARVLRRVPALGAAALAGARAGALNTSLESRAARLVGAGGNGMGRGVLTKGG